MKHKILFFMDLPSPVHGMSNVNLAVKTKALEMGLNPIVLNTTPSYAIKLFATKRWGIIKVVHKIWCMLALLLVSFCNIRGIFYRPINGGRGQIYDIVYLAIARMFLNKIYIHHHSFSYLNNKSRLFSLLKSIAGSNAIHVVLGEKMKSDLTNLYQINKHNILTLSNLAYFNAENVERTGARNLIKLGHLANLSVDKGADVFIQVCRELHMKNIKFCGEIAGPFNDLNTEKLVMAAVEGIPELHYLGPIYEEEKRNYYKRLDCFIFPSMYVNEAEPLVLFEAANYGAMVIGTQRGCMQDVICNLKGVSFREDEHLVSNIVVAIVQAIEDGSFNSSKKQQRLDNFYNEQVKANNAFVKFLEEMGTYGLSRSK